MKIMVMTLMMTMMMMILMMMAVAQLASPAQDEDLAAQLVLNI